jgi:hypothetical protein
MAKMVSQRRARAMTLHRFFVMFILGLTSVSFVFGCEDRSSSKSRGSAAKSDDAPKPPDISSSYKNSTVRSNDVTPEDIMNDRTPRVEADDPSNSKYHMKEAASPDFSAAANSAQFKAAIAQATQLCGSSPQPLKSGEDEKSTGGVVFAVPHARAETLLGSPRRQLLAQGATLFRAHNYFGIGEQNDLIGLLPTTDKYAVIAAMQTDGANYNIGTGDIIDWLKNMEKTQPWELTDASMDVVAGNFLSPVKDAKKLAKEMYEFCPDIVDQGTGDVDKLAAELAKGKLYFWWD